MGVSVRMGDTIARMMPRRLTVTLLALSTVAMLTACGSTAKPTSAPVTNAPVAATTTTAPAPKPTPTPDPIAAAITDRYGDCLVTLGFTKPFTIDIYKTTKKAVVSGKPGVITFDTGTSNTGNILTAPTDTDNSARALASAGC